MPIRNSLTEIFQFGLFQIGFQTGVEIFKCPPFLKSLHALRNQELRQRLRAAREGNGVTQNELAERLGALQSFVSKYETGERRLDVIEFADVCAALGIDAADFLRSLIVDTGDTFNKRPNHIKERQ